MSIPSFVGDRRQLTRGETSCEGLVSFYLEKQRDAADPLNAFISVDEGRAIDRARSVDASVASGEALPLAGMVLAVKDVICTKGGPVTCGSRILKGFKSLYDATVVQRLEKAGAVVIGKTNCDEFAMGSSNENSFFGPVRNPVDPSRVPGGSSGGSAAALRAGFCNAALGTDTGGSIRQPAAFCGVTGLKPTYGRVSRYGLVAYASSFDCIGPFGATVADIAASLQVMAGLDPHDATSAPVDPADYVAAVNAGVSGMRIGIPREFIGEGLDPEIRTALEQTAEQLEGDGATIQEVSLPHTAYGIATYYILTTAEASSNLARYDGVRYGYRSQVAEQNGSRLERLYTESRTEGFGTEVKRRIMLGTYVLSSGYYDAYYGKAQRVRSLIRSDFDRAFETVDVLLTP
ncbi:MAG: Asp-tRNA(Asn)/Glu-tRNA(Gln) amidotransferase subunit GatA, partial [Rhodothermia bacterium]|nr:Asp-tRNA(Asn)/Glu-tRNA(Gln) amidotransferase subunit GatA [Rhodothermia bacterium]